MKKQFGVLILFGSLFSRFTFADYYHCRGNNGQHEIIAEVNTITRLAHMETTYAPKYQMICRDSPLPGVILRCEGNRGRTLFLKGETADLVSALSKSS